MEAKWNGKVLAKSDDTIIVEGNHYFPSESIYKEFFKHSDTVTSCFWKGQASYYHLEVDGQINKDAAWYYASPMEAAENIKGYIAFWKGVEVK